MLPYLCDFAKLTGSFPHLKRQYILMIPYEFLSHLLVSLLYGIWCLALLLLSVFIYHHTALTGYSKARISFNLFHDQIKSVNKAVLFKESLDTLPVCRHSNPPAATRKCGHVTLSVRHHCHYRYYSSTFNFTFLRNKFADVQHPKDLVSKFDDFLVP